MKSIKKTVTDAQLTLNNEVLVEVVITDENGRTRVPNEVLFVNSTGATIGVIYLDDDAEKEVRLNHRNLYDFIPLSAGRSNGSLPSSIQYVIVKLLSGTPTADLDMYFMAFS